MKLFILLGGDAHQFGEGLYEVGVVPETALFTGVEHGAALGQVLFGDGDPPGGDIFVDGGAGLGFKRPADIGIAEVEMSSDDGNLQPIGDVFVDILDNIVHQAGFVGSSRLLAFFHGLDKELIELHHQFTEHALFHNVLAISVGGVGQTLQELVDQALLGFTQQHLVTELFPVFPLKALS